LKEKIQQRERDRVCQLSSGGKKHLVPRRSAGGNRINIRINMELCFVHTLRPEVNVLDLFRNRERSGNDELPKNLPLAALGSSPTRYARKGQSKPSIEAPKPKPKPKMDAIKATSTEPTHGAAQRKAPVVDEGSETREPQKRPKAGLMDTCAHVDTDNLSTRYSYSPPEFG
jgi:hypothetical protein